MRFPSPQEVGLPSAFPTWRPLQPQVIQDFLDSMKRYVGQVQRQGAGKTVSYIAIALLLKVRTMILTSNKTLQDQLLRDFACIGLTDIRGRANYTCQGLPTHNCESGAVAKCPYRGTMVCEYGMAKHLVTEAQLCTTNYSCWIASNKYGTGLGKFDLLIMDEAHNASSELERAMQIGISNREVTGILQSEWPGRREQEDMEAWKHWAQVRFLLADNELQRLKNKIAQVSSPSGKLVQEFQHLRTLTRKLADIGTCKPERWVVDTSQYGFEFDPIDASQYGERVLFNGIPKVLMTSGSLGERTREECGIEEADWDLFEYKSKFDWKKSPVYYLPTIKVTKDSPKWELMRLVKQIDRIIESRLDRRFIIHTGNFDIRDFIIDNSEYAAYMLTNRKKEGDITSVIIERYKQEDPPAILVSPSVTTGCDFPYDYCRVQIIAKLPFPNAGSKAEEARNKIDPERGTGKCITTLEQAVFRGDRADDDSQEVFILDDNIKWLIWRKRHQFSAYFLAMYQPISKLPPAPRLAA